MSCAALELVGWCMWAVYPQPSLWSAYLDFGFGMERMEFDILNAYIRALFCNYYFIIKIYCAEDPFTKKGHEIYTFGVRRSKRGCGGAQRRSEWQQKKKIKGILNRCQWRLQTKLGIIRHPPFGIMEICPSTPTTRPIQSMTDRLEPRITQHSPTRSWTYLRRRTNRWKGGYTPVFDPAFHSLGGGWDRMKTEWKFVLYTYYLFVFDGAPKPGQGFVRLLPASFQQNLFELRTTY